MSIPVTCIIMIEQEEERERERTERKVKKILESRETNLKGKLVLYERRYS